LKRRAFVRALLAPAAVAAGIALAGCNADDIPTTGRSLAPLSDKMLAEMQEKHMDKNSPILVRIFKEESELEVWKKNEDGEFALLKTYPICRWSGDLGPKKKEGDRQAPEGFYTITPAQMNPNSNYYLSFNTGYPNAYDRAWGHTGSELMVHGDCSSRGCYAMTDEQIREIYALARDSFFGGQKEFQFEAFPFRMTALNMAKHRNNPNFAFWKMLKEGYDDFEATHEEPKVAVCEKRYVFDAAAPEGSTAPLNFSPRGKCPVYRLDPTVADAVLDHRRQQQIKMAEYIAEGVRTVPPHVGDGGMNPVFASEIKPQEAYDSKGHLIEIATAPGSLPRTPFGSAPTSTVVVPQSAERNRPPVQPAQPVVMASVPLPQPAPLPKEGTAPPPPQTTIAGLLGNLFGGSKAEAQPEPQATLALRSPGTETAAKSRRATYRTASAPAHGKPLHSAAPTVVASHVAKPEPKQQPVKQAKQEAAPAKTMLTDDAPTPPNKNSLLAGAQPMVPVGSFDSRWAGLR
jgi:murein L,D-transpeptidase YafK